MYLALLLSRESERLIRTAVPSAGELHMAVIHSPDRSAAPPSSSTDAWWKLTADRTISAFIGGVERFGPPHKPVSALAMHFGLNLNEMFDLITLRGVAECALTSAGIAWSREWAFRPHVSLGPWEVARVPGVPLPRVAYFDRLEWRR